MDQQTVSFTVSKDDFSSALAWVARSLPAKPTHPILRGVLIDATDEGLFLSGFDREVSTRVHIAADITEAGRVLIAGKLIADIVGSLPDKPISLTSEGSTITLASGASRFDLRPMTIEDYPVLPTLPATTGHVDPHLFAQAITQVAVAAGKDDTLPMLTGIHVDIDGNRIVMAATDRFRLAVRHFDWKPEDPSAKATILVPARTLAEAARSLDPHDNKDLTIALGSGNAIGNDGLLGIDMAHRHMTTRLLDAEFPKFRPLLPTTHKTLASVEVGPLQDAIRRVSLLADRNAQIQMDFAPESLTLSAGGSEVGKATEQLACAFSGESLSIAFNPSYLKEGLAAITAPRVVFGFTLPSRPAILIPAPQELPEADEEQNFPTPETDFIYLLMPVRLPG